MTSALISISYHIQMSALGQLEFGISACRHLVASGAVGRRAAAIACDDALLLARDVAIDPGHPRIDLIGEQARPERLDVLGPGLHTKSTSLESRPAPSALTCSVQVSTPAVVASRRVRPDPCAKPIKPVTQSTLYSMLRGMLPSAVCGPINIIMLGKPSTIRPR